MTTRVRTHVNPLNFIYPLPHINLSEVFPHYSGEIDLEIGFGRGKFIQDYAQLHPDRHIIGIEIRQPLVLELQKTCQSLHLTNVFLLHASAQQLFDAIQHNAIIQHCFVFHPDPWLKKRYQKRRLITCHFLDCLHRKMKEKAKLFISTDVEDLYSDMKIQLTHSTDFQETRTHDFWESIYTSHWAEFSKKDLRTVYTLEYQKFLK